jgi:multicomponent Na+:H+ antiporter subunit D
MTACLLPLFGSTGMLGIAGVPPMGNFWSKLIIIIAAVNAGYAGIAVLCIIVAVITLGYFLNCNGRYITAG